MKVKGNVYLEVDNIWLKLKLLYYIYRKNCEKKTQMAPDQGINTYSYFKRKMGDL